MWQLDTARVEQKEAVKDARAHFTCVEARLYLLAVDLAFLILAIRKLIVVLHLWLLLADLYHTIDICNLHRETGLIFLAVNQAFVLVCGSFAAVLGQLHRMVFTLINMSRVDWLCHANRLELACLIVSRHIRQCFRACSRHLTAIVQHFLGLRLLNLAHVDGLLLRHFSQRGWIFGHCQATIDNLIHSASRELMGIFPGFVSSCAHDRVL